MKCLCGYEKRSDYEFKEDLKEWNDKQDEAHLKAWPVPEMPVNGDEEWISAINSTQFQVSEPGYTYDGNENRTIYACPKCGTLKIDV